MAKARDYKKEYKATQGTKRGKLDRAARNRARRKAEKAGLVHKGDGKEVHHPNNDPQNKKAKTQVISKAANRRMQPKRKKKTQPKRKKA